MRKYSSNRRVHCVPEEKSNEAGGNTCIGGPGMFSIDLIEPYKVKAFWDAEYFGLGRLCGGDCKIYVY